MTYNIITIGCQMNKSDSERLAHYLNALSFELEADFLKADLVLFVTCGVRQTAEDRLHGLINQIKKNNKKAVVCITGCLSDREDLHKALGDRVSVWFNISELLSLDKRLKVFFPKINLFSDKAKHYLELDADYSSSFSAYVPIGNGCDNFCSYCVVPHARGREKYREAYDILIEVQKLLKAGYKEIQLIAQNVNSYKALNDTRLAKEFNFKSRNKYIDFADLLKIVDNMPFKFWLKFSSSHPKDVSDKLIKVLKESKNVCEHFHLAVQSGDDKILKEMNRKYTVKDYKEKLRKIRLALDYKNGFTCNISSDVIVGYPGETKAQFNNTKKLFKEANFDMVYISKYSPRYKTASSYLEDDVSETEKRNREKELETTLRKIALKNNQQYLNKEVEVLVDGISRKGYLNARTRSAKLVRLDKKVDCPDKYLGKFVKVKIIKVAEFEMTASLIKKDKLVVILGPTASGKTSLAVKLAYKYNGEIVSADSRQVYKGMDIGSGKDLAEYSINGQDIKYHMIDVVSPKKVFSMADYQKGAFKAIDKINKEKKLAFLVGGSGLYLECVVDNYLLSSVKADRKTRDKYELLSLKELQSAISKINSSFLAKLNNSDLNNKRRLARYLEILLDDKKGSVSKGERLYDVLILGLSPERELIKKKIYKRLLDRINNEDMIGEVKRIHASGVSYQRLESFGLEYRYISLFLQKKISEKQLIGQLYTAICQFSKKQMSWFRRWEKLGAEIHWIKDEAEAISLIDKHQM